MPINFLKTVAKLEGRCEVDEAETLFEWLQEHPGGRVNLKECQALHAAVVQVLMALKPPISVAPDDKALQRWLMPVVAPEGVREG